jgi:hypothetical protein
MTKLLKPVPFTLGFMFFLLVAVILFNTLQYKPTQKPVKTIELPQVDGNQAAKRLSEAVQIKAVSNQDFSQVDTAEFSRFLA